MQDLGLCEAAGDGGGVQDKTGLDHRSEAECVAATAQHDSSGFHYRQ